MTPMQKKCFVASTGFHLLLLVILFVGPAFLSSRDKNDNLPVLEFIPMITTDKPFSGGGNPNANPPPAPVPAPQPQAQVAPPSPKPPPQVEKIEKPDPVKQPQTTKADPQALDTKTENKTRKIQVNTTLTTRSKVDAAKTKTPPKTDSSTSNKSSKDFANAANRIRSEKSSSTEIEMPGAGGGGPSYANYAQVVKSVYLQAWIEPNGVDDDEATAKVSVTIAREGTVISARIVEPSGNATVDRSVQDLLDRVKFIAPFPEGAKEDQRTYKINFNLKAKQLLG